MDIDLGSGLSRLSKLKGLTENKTPPEESKAEGTAPSAAKKGARDEIDLMKRISTFQQGFNSEEESEVVYPLSLIF